VRSACPLDCPDACSLDVAVEDGRVVALGGNRINPLTEGFICAKVRRFGEHVHSAERILHPAGREGEKGKGRFRRLSWDEALDRVASRMAALTRSGRGEEILPFSYGGSNGYLSQDTTDARLFFRLGASRLARTVCAAPSGRAAAGLYGKMPGIALHDYACAALVVLWGVNPSVSGIHLVPAVLRARSRGGQLVVIDPRRTRLAERADLHLALRPGTDLPLALSVIRWIFETGAADQPFLEAHATGVEELRRRAAPWTLDRAAAVTGLPAESIERFARLYVEASPAAIRCGWGIERNRNGGSAVAAVLALPAVAGKFGVPGGGYTMSNSAAWDLDRAGAAAAQPPPTREVNMNRLGEALLGEDGGRVDLLFVYNSNPLATIPNQEKVRRGLSRSDLFTVVFEQVVTDTARYADVLLPATTFVENYDLAKSYGPISLQLVRPVIEPVGEARPNPQVFSEIADRLGIARAEEETDTLLRIAGKLPLEIAGDLMEHGTATPAHAGAPVQFVDVFPLTPDRKVHLFSETLDREAPAGLYGYRTDPATDEFPLALISPASEKSVSSTLAELRQRAAVLRMNPDDALARGLATDDPVRVFNQHGEVHCPVALNKDIRPGTVSLPKGLWRKSTYNGLTSNALVPDSLTDLGGGACFNDARVQVASLGRH
jgi:anaerobic selenocysteine-containing dehydrogenase